MRYLSTNRRLKVLTFTHGRHHLKVGSAPIYVHVFFVFLSREGRDTISLYVAAPSSSVANVTLA